jgi:hypothetical protein
MDKSGTRLRKGYVDCLKYATFRPRLNKLEDAENEKPSLFWDIMPGSLFKANRRFGGTGYKTFRPER